MIEFCGASLKERLIFKRVYKAFRAHFALENKYSVELVFINADEMQALNFRTRGVDSVTDVLSFPTFSLSGVPKGEELATLLNDTNPLQKSLHLGSIAICNQRAKEQAEEYGHAIKREIGFLIVHGLLHLSGYDHLTEEDENKMLSLQKEILSLAKLKR